MKSNIYNLLSICLLLLSTKLISAQVVESVIISDTVKTEFPLKIISSGKNDLQFAITLNDNCNKIFKISYENVTTFVTDTGFINDIIIIDSILYCAIHSTLKGYNINSGKIVFWMQPTESIGGLSAIGDSVIILSDYEWDELHLLNIRTKKDLITKMNNSFVLRSPCYDKLRNKVYAVDNLSGIIVYDLNNGSESRIDVNTGGWTANKGLIVDNFGNIFISFYGKNGVYLADTISKNMVKIADIDSPGKISYDKVNNCILVADVNTSELYKIWLSENSNSIFTKKDEFYESSIYPNPSKNIVNFSFELKEANKGKINIVDLNGRIVKVFSEQLFHTGKNVFVWNGSELSAGTYFIKIHFDQSTISQKFIISR